MMPDHRLRDDRIGILLVVILICTLIAAYLMWRAGL